MTWWIISACVVGWLLLNAAIALYLDCRSRQARRVD
jgi:hypothetical protein